MSHGLALDHIAWSSRWRQRSLRDKGVLALGLLGCAVALPPLPGGLLAGVASLAVLLVGAKVRPALLLRMVWLPALSILIGVATIAITVGWSGGPTLGISPEGLTTAGQVAIRASAATLAMFIVACTTPMVDLFAGMRRAGIPEALVEIASLIYRLTFGLLESLVAIHAAQEARLGYSSRSAGLRSASMATASIFLRSWDHARRLEDGLAGRGYEGSLRTLEPARRRSTRFLILSVLGLVALITLSLLWKATS